MLRSLVGSEMCIRDSYGADLQKFLNTEKLRALEKSVKDIKEQTSKALNISIAFKHKDGTRQLTIEEHGEEIQNNIKATVNHGFGNFDVLLTKKISSNSSTNEVELRFRLQNSDGNDLPKEYMDRFTPESKDLWKIIRNSITENLKFVDSIEQNEWEPGSIIISAILHKCSVDKDWTEKNKNQMESLLPDIHKDIENKRREFKCKVERVVATPSLEPGHDVNIFSFRLIAKTQVGIEKLDKVEKDPDRFCEFLFGKFEIFLNSFIANHFAYPESLYFF